MVTTKERMVHMSITLDAEKIERLKAIAAARRVPMAVLWREGLERVLDLAEKQQATVDRYHQEKAARQ